MLAQDEAAVDEPQGRSNVSRLPVPVASFEEERTLLTDRYLKSLARRLDVDLGFSV